MLHLSMCSTTYKVSKSLISDLNIVVGFTRKVYMLHWKPCSDKTITRDPVMCVIFYNLPWILRLCLRTLFFQVCYRVRYVQIKILSVQLRALYSITYLRF